MALTLQPPKKKVVKKKKAKAVVESSSCLGVEHLACAWAGGIRSRVCGALVDER
jgi:hypothetical protein